MKHEKQPFNEFEVYSRLVAEVGAEAVEQVVEVEAVETEDLSEAA